MGTVGYGVLAWDESDFVEKIVCGLSNIENVDAVEWIQQSPNSMYQDLVRIETVQGSIFRLGLSWVEDEEVEEDFDDAFRQYFLAKSFELLGCSCAKRKLQLKGLAAQLDIEVLEFRGSLVKSPLGEAIAALKQEIAEIDLLEHPHLDKMAADAYPYLDQWIADQEDSVVEGMATRALIFQYAQEWRNGWRPEQRD